MNIELVGMQSEKAAAIGALENNLAVLLYGASGNGKTILAHDIAKELSGRTGLPIVYLQLYPEMTKNSLIGGETLKDGSIVTKNQSIIEFGAKGAIFIIDECTHTTEPVLLAFNSLIEEPFTTVIGSEVVKMSEHTRFIFCGNTPDHAGNIPLPTSFSTRLFIINTPLLDKDKIVEIGKEVNKEVPEEILDFVANVIVTTNDSIFPISPRNMVMFCRNFSSVLKSGYDDAIKLPKGFNKLCKKLDINGRILKNMMLSSLMAHVVSRSDGAKKVEAMLWD